MNRRPVAAALLALVLMLLGACASSPGGSPNKREEQLRSYSVAVRWNDFDDAFAHIEPAIRAQHPFTDFERERYKQIQVTGYDVLHQAMSPDGLVLEQTVEIRLINRNTQIERSINDHQRWTYDVANKRWWLVSGLPDFFSPR